MRYSVKFIAGDPYYQEMSVEETVQKMFVRPESDEKVLRSQEDIDAYISDNFTEMLPIDGPLVRVYLQEIAPGDMADMNGSKHRSLYIFKCHHAFGDGVSLGALTLAATDEYDLSYFPGARSATFWEVAYVRLAAILSLP
jgi:hypothetical protein